MDVHGGSEAPGEGPMKQMKALWIFENGPCRRCGSRDCPTIDHIDPKTKDPSLRVSGGGTGGTNAIWGWSIERREQELAKCQILCETCHRRKTFGEANGDPAELVRRELDLAAKRQRLLPKSDYQLMLETVVVLPADMEAKMEEIRRRYGFQDDVECVVDIGRDYVEETCTGSGAGK